MTEPDKRLVVVSNRLPISLEPDGDSWKVLPGSGGLVTALAPVLRDRGGFWIGWLGAPGDLQIDGLLEDVSKESGYNLKPVFLSQEEVDEFYLGFSNEIIWPLFHDFVTRCNFNPSYWQTYMEVNCKFADVVAENSRDSDYIWVHDYHLMNVASCLKGKGVERNTGFFLHIPFPAPDIFLRLPWRAQVLQALLEYNLVGFQTLRDRRNFIQCLRFLCPDVRTSGRGAVVTLYCGDKRIRLASLPISIDYHDFADLASSQEIWDQMWKFQEVWSDRVVILGADRLDYSKGIPERLEAFRTALNMFPELHEKISFMQILVPSREKVSEYKELKHRIEGMVGEINGQFSRPGWVPVHYQYRNLRRRELVAYYRASRIAMVTPLRDGMNLVAKEYCATNVEENGVLILSEFAGAAAQLQGGAILINPHDITGMAEAIHSAYNMPKGERADRMRRMRQYVRKHDLFWWVDAFLNAAFSAHLDEFPSIEMDHFVPSMDVK